ncbi:Pre-mRNA cleavage complex II protein Clp1-domain-containing protein [Auriculariales sp. MPI-PUGE-AT-0066]|nr:Pre-mRNA cleavage complex II protein Clp1-domain-containing protein [Auriculariales sp. MPI-PUGE-AT-0066]
MAQNPWQPREWVLDAETEYRFELEIGTTISVTVIRGTAEVFGAELAPTRTYLFGHSCKAAIFSWEGCTLEMSTFITPSCQLSNLANARSRPPFHGQMRVRARQAQRGSRSPNGIMEAPRILVLGPEGAGKTSLCKILTNYAVRMGVPRSPVLVNLDPSEGGWSAPGALSACSITQPLHTSTPTCPFGTTASSAPTIMASSALVPLVYWFGHKEPRRNNKLMDHLIETLGAAVDARLQDDDLSRISGVIIDTPAGFASHATGASKHPTVEACVNSFHVNHILVIGNEKLFVEMQRLFGDSGSIQVTKVPKSGGVVELDYAYRERILNQQLRAYMYGIQLEPPADIPVDKLGGDLIYDLSLSPHSSVVSFGDISIYRVGGAESMAPSSALPIGGERRISEVEAIPVDPSQPGSGLLNAVLALLSQSEMDGDGDGHDQQLALHDIAGFVIITSIDITSRKMTVLSPTSGSLAGRVALVGSLEWQEN